ncbi:alpha-ribazole phosphatase [Wukongibacter baidiensis]|uniref:alpha-ribazole phosphatase n=1 Tax=Wukongibacter baidiensis TaxID=1723361 RepID=UPI003D7F51AA
MLDITFVRHGESDMNKKGVYCGWSNSLLTKKGLVQAEEVRKKLADEEFDIIISSDLDRCLMTAEIINRSHGKEIVKETALKELNFGDWEGCNYEDICTNYPKETKLWQNDYVNFKIPNGESLLEMHDRVNKRFDEIISKFSEGKILIVSHSGAIRSILAQQICGGVEGVWKFKIDNCGITRLQISHDFPIIIGINQ